MMGPKQTPNAKIAINLKKAVNQFKRAHAAELEQGSPSKDDLKKILVSPERLSKMSPTQGAYIFTQNLLSAMGEDLLQHPSMKALRDAILDAEDEYVPSGPPTSPLTGSYFSIWSFFDLYVGKHRETVGSCILAIADELGIDSQMKQIIEHLHNSRMGIYSYVRKEGALHLLRELITEEELFYEVPSGYNGKPGELWLTRALPPPFHQLNTGIVFGTPYILIRTTPTDWLHYFDRTLPKIKLQDKKLAYRELMKWGLSRRYWNEYIVEAYVNYLPSAIFLSGFPDIAASRPHSDEA